MLLLAALTVASSVAVWVAPVAALPAVAVLLGRDWALRLSLPLTCFHLLSAAVPKRLLPRPLFSPLLLAACLAPPLLFEPPALLMRGYGLVVAWAGPLYALLEAYEVERALAHGSRLVITWILEREDEDPRLATFAKLGVLAVSGVCYSTAAVAAWLLYSDPARPPSPAVATAVGAMAALCAVATVVAFASRKGAITTSAAATLYAALAIRRGAAAVAAVAHTTKATTTTAAVATTGASFSGFLSMIFGGGGGVVQKTAAATKNVAVVPAARAAAMSHSLLSFDSLVSLALAVLTMTMASIPRLSTEPHSAAVDGDGDGEEEVPEALSDEGAWQRVIRRALYFGRRTMGRAAAVLLFTNAVLGSCGLEQPVGVAWRLLQVVVVLVLYSVRVLYPVTDNDDASFLHED